MEKWIGIRMTHQRRIKKATNKKNKDVKKKKKEKGGRVNKARGREATPNAESTIVKREHARE